MTPIRIWIEWKCVNMSGYVALDAGICIYKPSPAELSSTLKYLVLDHVLHCRVLMLKLVSKEQARKPSPDCDYFQFSSWCVCRNIFKEI